MIELVTDARGDRISLTVPSTDGYRGVVSLVTGGVGGRLELPYEQTDDLQLAILAALESAADDAVTVELVVEDEALHVAVGPLADGAGEDAGLLRILRPLVDSVEATHRDGREWLALRLSRPSVANG